MKYSSKAILESIAFYKKNAEKFGVEKVNEAVKLWEDELEKRVVSFEMPAGVYVIYFENTQNSSGFLPKDAFDMIKTGPHGNAGLCWAHPYPTFEEADAVKKQLVLYYDDLFSKYNEEATGKFKIFQTTAAQYFKAYEDETIDSDLLSSAELSIKPL